MNRAAKLVIVIEDNNVQEVYAPAGLDIQYFSIDRDDQSEEEIHVVGWRDAMTHADLLQHNKQYFRLAFGRKTRRAAAGGALGCDPYARSSRV